MGTYAPALAAAAALAGCATGGARPFQTLGPAAVTLLDDSLLRVEADFRGRGDANTYRRLTDCAAAEALVARGANFARHVRTTVSEEGGISRLDAVYTVSPTLPAGPAVIDAESVAAHCREQGTTGG